MGVSYSLQEGKVKKTISHSAVATDNYTKQAYVETRILKEKTDMLKEMKAEKDKYQTIVDAYNAKISALNNEITQINAL